MTLQLQIPNIEAALQQVRHDANLKAFYLRAFRLEPNNAFTLEKLLPVSKLSAIEVLRLFPELLVKEPQKKATKDEKLCFAGIQLAFNAKAAWLLYWWSGGTEPHPRQIDPLFEDYEIDARLSQFRWDLILAIGDRNPAFKQAFPSVGCPWLLSEMAICLQMMGSQFASNRDFYLNFKGFNDASREPIESNLVNSAVPDEFLLTHFDKAIEMLARQLSCGDEGRKFRYGYWEPYWRLKQRFGSVAKKKGRILCSAPPPPKTRGKKKGL